MPIDPRASHLIEQLGMVPHPEGGHFREVYRSTAARPARRRPRRSIVADDHLLSARFRRGQPMAPCARPTKCGTTTRAIRSSCGALMRASTRSPGTCSDALTTVCGPVHVITAGRVAGCADDRVVHAGRVHGGARDSTSRTSRCSDRRQMRLRRSGGGIRSWRCSSSSRCGFRLSASRQGSGRGRRSFSEAGQAAGWREAICGATQPRASG